jgi:hypothetical protein
MAASGVGATTQGKLERRCTEFGNRARRKPKGLERVMNSIRKGLGMGKTEIAKEPSRLWNPHFYAVFVRVHNTL